MRASPFHYSVAFKSDDLLPHREKSRGDSTCDLGHSHGPARELPTDYSSTQAHFDVLILEAGIIFHSIMIGVSLGASGGDQWIPLFIAIVFHQLFEGLALGSRIGQLVWRTGQAWKKWAMAVAFAVSRRVRVLRRAINTCSLSLPHHQLITPLGIAIGMGVHASYNPNSGASLLSIGILDSISAGILIYGGIVECLYHDVGGNPFEPRPILELIHSVCSSCTEVSRVPVSAACFWLSFSCSRVLCAWCVNLSPVHIESSLTDSIVFKAVLGKWA